MFIQLVVLVYHLPSRRFTFHANLTRILDLIMSTEESLYTRAMVKQIGLLQTALTARVDTARSNYGNRHQSS